MLLQYTSHQFKQCTKCGISKAFNQFGSQNDRKGRRSHCLACTRKRSHDYARRITLSVKEFKPTKCCRKCNVEKSRDEFYNYALSKDGKYSTCRSCRRQIEHAYKQKNPAAYKARRRNYWRQHRDRYLELYYPRYYGISYQDYQNLSNLQNSLCAICGHPPKSNKKLVVDHDHKTGKVRQLLCHKCNMIIGLLNEDPTYFQKALSYVQKHTKGHFKTGVNF